MSRPRKLTTGKWTITVQDTRRNIPRTKRNFDTRAECTAWEKAVKEGAFNHLVGKRPRRTVGEALARYLREITPHKRHPRNDHSNTVTLRWPVWDSGARRWLRLEDTYLDDLPTAAAAWTADLRRITRRAYHGAEHYHHWRADDGTSAWYHQPRPTGTDRPAHRMRVTDAALIARIEAGRPRGPLDSGTLRQRQIMLKHILRLAWRDWDWLEADISAKITLAKPSAPRDTFLTAAELEHFIAEFAHGDPHAADFLTAAALIGWRRTNITYLTWDTVHLPTSADLDDGHYWTTRQTTKNGEPLMAPMGQDTAALFLRRWAARNGPYVFHRHDGTPWVHFDKRFRAARRRAGIDPTFRYHDLRHTWASHKIQAGVPDAHIQALGGWKTASMVRRYGHLRIDHLRGSAS